MKVSKSPRLPRMPKKLNEFFHYTCMDGLRTICLNWPFKFSIRLITRHSKIPHSEGRMFCFMDLQVINFYK